ncbi:MAG: alanyl-tRNA synthetase [Rubrobacteraceae bacterium]|nr:alanyl-tRNA synthetase [Rubrobacteraceae bacterium]
MQSSEIRRRFLDFFVERGHMLYPSASLIPHNDPTVLLTTGGVQQFIPYFLGQERPPSTRAVSVQKCFRTPDIEDAGGERAEVLPYPRHRGCRGLASSHLLRDAWELLVRRLLQERSHRMGLGVSDGGGSSASPRARTGGDRQERPGRVARARRSTTTTVRSSPRATRPRTRSTVQAATREIRASWRSGTSSSISTSN